MMRSDLCWCSDGLEFTGCNGDVIRMAFPIDAHDREIISWRAVANIGISGSDVRDMPPEAVERRFASHRNLLRGLQTMAASVPSGARASSRNNRA